MIAVATEYTTATRGPSLGTILVADDDPPFLETTCDVLREAGYVVEAAADASSARSELLDRTYDALIADIQMPGSMDLDFLEDLTTGAAWVPVIVVTGYPSIATAVKALRLPVVAYLSKPLDIDLFLAEVQRATRLARAHRSICAARERALAIEQSSEVDSSLDPAIPAGSDVAVRPLLADIRSILGELEVLVSASCRMGPGPPPAGTWHRLPASTVALLQEAVGVLEQNQSSIVTRDLVEVRSKIEQLLAGLKSPSDSTDPPADGATPESESSE